MKNIVKTLLFYFLIINDHKTALAQNMHHNSLWSRVDLQAKLTEKKALNLELMYRTQSNFNENNRNPFSEPLTYSTRIWYNYKYNKQLTFMISPFSYWKSYSLIRQMSDIGKKSNIEFRFTFATELKQSLPHKIDFIQRFWIEHRMIKNQTNTSITNFNRFRTKLALRYSLTSHLSLLAADELIIQFGKPLTPSNYFDQNRIIIGATYKLNNRLKIDFGMMPIVQKRKDLEIFDDIKVSYLNFNYLIFEKKNKILK